MPRLSSLGRKRRPFRVLPVAGCRFGWERQNPTGKRRVKVAEHESMRRYASHARHGLDPVCLFHRQVRDAWSWPRAPGEVLEQNFRITAPDPKTRGLLRSRLAKKSASTSPVLEHWGT